ncbi:MAG: DNA polymerase III subunit beta [Deltaproteobacteria bacterium]|jgi:DNA polymerase-3 subunit beta|nr:DNA polymerase III subunit beta [Deltaproteobacteria bacterium]
MFKVRVRREELAKMVAQCSSVVAKRSTMDIFMRILLTAEENHLTMSATDLEVTLQTRIPAEVSGTGEVAIKPKSLSDYLRGGTADEVLLELGENFTLHAVCGGYKSDHFGISSEHFPLISRAEESEFVRIDARALSDAIDKTIYSVSSSDETYNLKGIYFIREEAEDTPKCLKLVSTDAQRLNVATVQAENLDVFPETGGLLVPRKGLQELRNLCEPLVDIHLGVYDNSLVARTDDSVMKIRLLSGNFPEYRAILPTELGYRIWLNRKNFLATVKRICILTDDNYHLAKFVFNGDLLTISSTNPELGQTEDSLGIDYDGPEITTRFNPNFFVDLLDSLKSDRVSLEFSDSHPSYFVTAPEDPGYSGVLVSVSYDV